MDLIVSDWWAVLCLAVGFVVSFLSYCVWLANHKAAVKDDMLCAKVDRVWSAFLLLFSTVSKAPQGKNSSSNNK